MFPTRMDSGKPGFEVLQDAFLEKEGPDRNTEGWKCIGNLYCSYDGCPFKLSAEGKRNTNNFQNIGGNKICFSCGNVANRQWCGACKMTEY